MCRIFELLLNIYLFSSSCLCSVGCLSFVRWKKNQNKYYIIFRKFATLEVYGNEKGMQEVKNFMIFWQFKFRWILQKGVLFVRFYWYFRKTLNPLYELSIEENVEHTWMEASIRSRGFWIHSSHRFSLEPVLEVAAELASEVAEDWAAKLEIAPKGPEK